MQSPALALVYTPRQHLIHSLFHPSVHTCSGAQNPAVESVCQVRCSVCSEVGFDLITNLF